MKKNKSFFMMALSLSLCGMLTFGVGCDMLGGGTTSTPSESTSINGSLESTGGSSVNNDSSVGTPATEEEKEKAYADIAAALEEMATSGKTYKLELALEGTTWNETYYDKDSDEVRLTKAGGSLQVGAYLQATEEEIKADAELNMYSDDEEYGKSYMWTLMHLRNDQLYLGQGLDSDKEITDAEKAKPMTYSLKSLSDIFGAVGDKNESLPNLPSEKEPTTEEILPYAMAEDGMGGMAQMIMSLGGNIGTSLLSAISPSVSVSGNDVTLTVDFKAEATKIYTMASVVIDAISAETTLQSLLNSKALKAFYDMYLGDLTVENVGQIIALLTAAEEMPKLDESKSAFENLVTFLVTMPTGEKGESMGDMELFTYKERLTEIKKSVESALKNINTLKVSVSLTGKAISGFGFDIDVKEVADLVISVDVGEVANYTFTDVSKLKVDESGPSEKPEERWCYICGNTEIYTKIDFFGEVQYFCEDCAKLMREEFDGSCDMCDGEEYVLDREVYEICEICLKKNDENVGGSTNPPMEGEKDGICDDCLTNDGMHDYDGKELCETCLIKYKDDPANADGCCDECGSQENCTWYVQAMDSRELCYNCAVKYGFIGEGGGNTDFPADGSDGKCDKCGQPGGDWKYGFEACADCVAELDKENGNGSGTDTPPTVPVVNGKVDENIWRESFNVTNFGAYVGNDNSKSGIVVDGNLLYYYMDRGNGLQEVYLEQTESGIVYGYIASEGTWLKEDLTVEGMDVFATYISMVRPDFGEYFSAFAYEESVGGYVLQEDVTAATGFDSPVPYTFYTGELTVFFEGDKLISMKYQQKESNNFAEMYCHSYGGIKIELPNVTDFPSTDGGTEDGGNTNFPADGSDGKCDKCGQSGGDWTYGFEACADCVAELDKASGRVTEEETVQAI